MNMTRAATDPLSGLSTGVRSHIPGQRVHAAASALSRSNWTCLDSPVDISE